MEQKALRALSVSEILDAALRLYRANFIAFLGIAAAALIPEGILEAILIGISGGADIQRLQNSLTSFFTNIATMALIIAISSAYLGEPFAIGSSYSKGLKRFWSVIGANILMGLAIFLPLVFFAVCLFAAASTSRSSSTSMVLLIGFLIILLPIMVFLFTRWSLALEAIILEDIGASAGLKRTWELTGDYFWRVLGTSFAAGLLTGLLTVLPFLVVDAILSFTGINYTIIQLIDLVVQQVALVISLPFSISVQVLIYYDLRIRKEGFDLMLRTGDIQPGEALVS